MTTFTPSPIIFALRTVSTRVYGTCIGAAKMRSCATLSRRNGSGIRRTSCCSTQLCPALFVQRCRAVPSTVSKTRIECTLYCTPFVVHVQSKKDYDDGTCLLLSRRLGLSSDRNITKRLCYPVWSCCWHVGTRTVLPNLHDAIFACHLNGQICFTNLALEDAFTSFFQDDQDVTTQSFYPTIFFDGL